MNAMTYRRQTIGASKLEWVPLGKSVPYKSGYDHCTQLTTVVDGQHPIYGVRRIYGGYASNYLDANRLLFSPTPVTTPTNNTNLAIAYVMYFGDPAAYTSYSRTSLSASFTSKVFPKTWPVIHEFVCSKPIYLLYVQNGMTDYEAFEILIEKETYRPRTPYTYNY